MKVTLRQRNQGGQTSLYLDYYHKGKRKTEYLKLYLDPNAKTKEEKEVNKKTMQLAETIRAQRQIEIQNGVYGFRDQEKQKGSFLSYIELLALQRDDSPGNHGNWTSEDGLKAGGKEPNPMLDEGFMQLRSIEDLDGHVWGVICLDIEKFKIMKQ
jgi:hypothetical protein